MGRSLILETSFLVDFERENNRGVPGPALAFLEAHEDDRPYITVAGELAAGHYGRVPDLQVETYRS